MSVPDKAMKLKDGKILYDNLRSMVAVNFDQATANDAGSYVCYQGAVYYLPDGHTAGTTWANTTKVGPTNIGGEVSTLKSAIQQKYTLPSGGIPSTDLASGVQTSLGKADTAYQKPSTGIPASDLASGVIPSVPVQDVQIDGTSILSSGVANIPKASTNDLGVIKVGSGLFVSSSGVVVTNKAVTNNIKAGTEQYEPIVPFNQHISTFYGLATAAGNTDQSSSSNPVGTYTSDAQLKIQQMLGLWTPKVYAREVCEEAVTNFPGNMSATVIQLGDTPLNIWEELVVVVYQTGNSQSIATNDWCQVYLKDNINSKNYSNANWLKGTSPVIVRYKRFPRALVVETGYVANIGNNSTFISYVRDEDYVDIVRGVYMHCEGGTVNVGTAIEAYIHRFI